MSGEMLAIIRKQPTHVMAATRGGDAFSFEVPLQEENLGLSCGWSNGVDGMVNTDVKVDSGAERAGIWKCCLI